MNNLQIKMAIKENWDALEPGAEWTESRRLRLDATVMSVEKAIKTIRETYPGMSRLQACSEVMREFLKAPPTTE